MLLQYKIYFLNCYIHIHIHIIYVRFSFFLSLADHIPENLIKSKIIFSVPFTDNHIIIHAAGDDFGQIQAIFAVYKYNTLKMIIHI